MTEQKLKSNAYVLKSEYSAEGDRLRLAKTLNSKIAGFSQLLQFLYFVIKFSRAPISPSL